MQFENFKVASLRVSLWKQIQQLYSKSNLNFHRIDKEGKANTAFQKLMDVMTIQRYMFILWTQLFSIATITITICKILSEICVRNLSTSWANLLPREEIVFSVCSYCVEQKTYKKSHDTEIVESSILRADVTT